MRGYDGTWDASIIIISLTARPTAVTVAGDLWHSKQVAGVDAAQHQRHFHYELSLKNLHRLPTVAK